MGLETIGVASRELLAMLDMTSAGIGPDHLLSDVQVVIEGQAFMGRKTLAVQGAFNAPAAAGADTTAAITVPPPSVWLVREFGWYVEFPASAQVQRYRMEGFIQAAVRPPTTLGTPTAATLGTLNGTIMRWVESGPVGQTIAGNPGVTRWGGQKDFGTMPIICYPGSVIGGLFTNGNVNNDAATACFMWVRFNELTPTA